MVTASASVRRRPSTSAMTDGATKSELKRPSTAGPVERFEPEALRGELLEAEHLVRYLWAVGAVAGRDVLDLGCGNGYGCALIASVGGAQRCVGVDVAEDAIAQARERYGADERLEFLRADAAALSLDDSSFDAVTCFETIEHVDDPAALVAEAARVLRPDGLFIVSSPNRAQYPPGNPYHVKEFLPDELRALLSGSFSEVALFRQHNWIASAILDDAAFAAEDASEEIGLSTSKVQRRNPGEELYTLAVCSDSPVPEPPLRVLLTHGLEVRRWLQEIQREIEFRLERENELRLLGDELARTREALAACERELLELRDARSTTMGELERQAYWLQRAEIDPEALVSRRPVRWAFRLFQFARRVRRKLLRR
jgi:SAM-dependent methyltransferase